MLWISRHGPAPFCRKRQTKRPSASMENAEGHRFSQLLWRSRISPTQSAAPPPAPARGTAGRSAAIALPSGPAMPEGQSRTCSIRTQQRVRSRRFGAGAFPRGSLAFGLLPATHRRRASTSFVEVRPEDNTIRAAMSIQTAMRCEKTAFRTKREKNQQLCPLQ